jgi:DNA-binding NarL/FixJ family response regulator
MSIRVLLVDDHKIVRDGLRSLLAKQMDIEVVGEADNGREALERTRELRPDVVVMDIGMCELNGIETTRQVIRDTPEIRVVALSMHSDRHHITDMLAAGAVGYLLKDSAFEELTLAIRAVAEGRTFLSRRVSETIIDDYVKNLNSPDAPAAAPAGRALSPREREVLQLIAGGSSTKECAARLHLSVKTIETHRRNVMDKLGVYSIAGLIKYAVREGLASLED